MIELLAFSLFYSNTVGKERNIRVQYVTGLQQQ
jgi:hypothetical protein